MEDIQQLGSSIEINGFSIVDQASMVIVKKVIGSYARKFSDKNVGFEKLTVILSKDESQDSFQVEAQAKTTSSLFNSKINEKNLFVGIDSVLKNLESQLLP
jgi:ribosome-associated translation inhibitor RaiA